MKRLNAKLFASVALLLGLSVAVAFAQSTSNPGGRAILHNLLRGIFPTGSVSPSEASTALKTKTTITATPFSAADQKYIFVAPVACTIVSVGIVSDTATTGSNEGTNWSFQVANLTIGSNLVSSVTNTAGNEITGDAYYDLAVDQWLSMSANAVLELQVSSNGTPTALSSAEVLAVVRWY